MKTLHVATSKNTDYDWEDDSGIIALAEWHERKEWRTKVADDLSKISELTVDDWIGMFVYLNKDVKKIPLFKMLFLFNARSGLSAKMFDWYPYNFGPYSKVIESTLANLEEKEIITREDKKTQDGHIAKIYKMKDNSEAKKHVEMLPKSIHSLVTNVIKFCNEKDNEKDLLHYVHAAYPAFATEANE